MGAGADQKIHVFGGVVHLMEAPEQGYFMRPAMTPVETEISDEERRKAAQPQRPSGDRRVNLPRHESVGNIGRNAERNDEHEVGQKAAQEIESQVADRLSAKDLLRVHGEQ